MSGSITLLPEKYYQNAELRIDDKDLVDFVTNIGIAIEVGEDPDFLAKATMMKVIGLYKFNQHKKALETVDIALKYNTGTEAFRLKKFRGILKGYLGEIEEALNIFKGLIKETNDSSMLAQLCINIVWVQLTLDKKNICKEVLQESKVCLDLAMENFDNLEDELKWRLLNNYSTYCYYTKEYEKSIQLLEEALNYCSEKDSAFMYINLAEAYLESDPDGVSERVYEYLKKGEVISSEHQNKLALGYTYYIKALVEIKEDQLFTALDTLYLSVEYFKEAEALSCAIDSILKINELTNDYKVSFMKNMQEKLKGTPYYTTIL